MYKAKHSQNSSLKNRHCLRSIILYLNLFNVWTINRHFPFLSRDSYRELNSANNSTNRTPWRYPSQSAQPARRIYKRHCPDNWCSRQRWRLSEASGRECWVSPSSCPPTFPRDTRARIWGQRRTWRHPNSPGSKGCWTCARRMARSSRDRATSRESLEEIGEHHGTWCPSEVILCAAL